MTEEVPARRFVCIGRIAGVWGVEGWVRIHSYTRHRADVFSYRQWMLGDAGSAAPLRRYELESGQEQGRTLVAKLRGLEDREAAVGEVGALVHVSPEQLPPLVEGEYFWYQLEGLSVRTPDGAPLGKVDHLFETGANDVMVVVAGERERLIPYVDEVVREVDLETGIIHVEWDPDF